MSTMFMSNDPKNILLKGDPINDEKRIDPVFKDYQDFNDSGKNRPDKNLRVR
jgi:hypothetical protein